MGRSGSSAQGKGTGKRGPGRKRSEVHIEDNSALRRQGDETTLYRAKTASWALAAQRLSRSGWPQKKIAKRFGVSVADVRKALER